MSVAKNQGNLKVEIVGVVVLIASIVGGALYFAL